VALATETADGGMKPPQPVVNRRYRFLEYGKPSQGLESTHRGGNNEKQFPASLLWSFIINESAPC
jgi:hypothetical protein